MKTDNERIAEWAEYVRLYDAYIKWLNDIGGDTSGIIPLNDIMRWKEENDQKIW